MICVESVSVCPRSLTLKTGEWYYCSVATVCPTDANCNCVTWHSDNTNVATVNPSSGYIYAKAVGTAKIYATVTDCCDCCCDYITVTVSDTVKVTSVELNKSSVSIEKGTGYELSATIVPSNATNKNLDWNSSNTSVATVDNGVIQAVNTGCTTITVTALDGSGKSDSCTVVVVENILVTSVTINPSDVHMVVGGSCFLYETVLPSNATNKNVLWESSDTGVAIVSPSGKVSAKSVGNATIYATAQDGSETVGTCSINVANKTLVECLNVNPTNMTLYVGDRRGIIATICPANATDQSVTWHCDNTDVVRLVDAEEPDPLVRVAETLTAGNANVTIRTADQVLTETVPIKVFWDDVVILQDGAYNQIEFKKEKMIWNCIYHDMINDLSVLDNDELVLRANQNLCINYRITDNGIGVYDGIKTYSDAQIKLIYAIDPLGLAKYVKDYASHLFSETDGTENDKLRSSLEFKDYIFEVLYKRTPTYFARSENGEWHVTTETNNSKAVISESEFLFGLHPVFDDLTISQLEDILNTIFSIFLGDDDDDNNEEKIIAEMPKVQAYNFWIQEEVTLSSVVSAMFDEAFGKVLKALKIDWIYNIVSFFNNLEELAELIVDSPEAYRVPMQYCLEFSEYNIMVEMKDGTKQALMSIHDLIN